MVSQHTKASQAASSPEDLKIAFGAKLNAMQAKFKQGLPARMDDLKHAWTQVKESEGDHESLILLHRLAHTLTGSAGTFACQQLSLESRALEMLLKRLLDDDQLYDTDVALQIETKLKRLVEVSLIDNECFLSGGEAPAKGYSSRKLHNKILIIEGDAEINHYLTVQLEHFGYEVKGVLELVNVSQTIEQYHPDLIICDISFPEGELAGIDMIKSLTEPVANKVPVIFISARQDVMARLQAVQAKGQAYLTKPIDISDLVDKVSELTESVEVEPYRIMVIDDDPALVDLTVFILKESGMDAFGLTDPLEILEHISENQPDLILMDVHMPACTGIEMAQVIRQQKKLAGIPIIFLSSEMDEEMQFKAVLQGGDDFLTKPVEVRKLPLFIESRAKRAREMSALMIRDGLTGLYNHTYIKEMINTELERFTRSGYEVSVAMLDIDYFKKVNDTYGHMVGDQVLRSLSSFLVKRLRKSDKVGRYGGEEFVIVLPETPLKEAISVMNSVLSSFREVVHSAAEKDFHVTFSCGVISSKMTTNVNQLINAMDQALYKAKHAGRNQVIEAVLN